MMRLLRLIQVVILRFMLLKLKMVLLMTFELSSSIHKSPFALDITFFSSEYWGRSESHIR